MSKWHSDRRREQAAQASIEREREANRRRLRQLEKEIFLSATKELRDPPDDGGPAVIELPAYVFDPEELEDF